MKILIRPQLALLALIVTINAQLNYAYGQAYNCNGIWSTTPCKTGTPLAILNSGLSTPKSEEDLKAIADKNKKESLVHDLNMKSIKAEREYQLRYDIVPISEYCKLSSTSVLDCSQKVNEMHDRIDTRINEVETLNIQKKANELQAEKNKLQTESGKASTTIIKQNVYVGLPSPTPRYIYHDPFGKPYPGNNPQKNWQPLDNTSPTAPPVYTEQSNIAPKKKFHATQFK
jgi:hypothetical protein